MSAQPRDPLNGPPSQLELGGLMTADPLTLIEHVDAEGMPPGYRWPETLAGLYSIWEALLRRTKLTEAEQYELVRDAMIAVGGYMGGHAVYLPTLDTLRIAIRDRQIWAQHLHGTDLHTLMRESGLCQTQMYAVLRQQRKLFERRLQGRLFED